MLFYWQGRSFNFLTNFSSRVQEVLSLRPLRLCQRLPRRTCLLFSWFIVAEIRLMNSFLEKKVDKCCVSYKIRAYYFFWNRNDSEISKEVLLDASKIIRSWIFGIRKSFCLIFLPIFSKSVFTIKKMLQFKKCRTSYKNALSKNVTFSFQSPVLTYSLSSSLIVNFISTLTYSK